MDGTPNEMQKKPEMKEEKKRRRAVILVDYRGDIIALQEEK